MKLNEAVELQDERIDESVLGKISRGTGVVGGYLGAAAPLSFSGIGGLSAISLFGLSPVAIGLGGFVLAGITLGAMWQLGNMFDNRDFRNRLDKLRSVTEQRDQIFKYLNGREPGESQQQDIEKLTNKQKDIGDKLNRIYSRDEQVRQTIETKMTNDERKKALGMIEAARDGKLSFLEG